MKYFKKRDIFIVVGVLAACLIAWGIYTFAFQEKGAKAEIYDQSNLIKTIDLDKGEEKIISLPQNKHVKLKLYEDGSIAFIESNCPDKVCINTGRINIVGKSAACLPNGIIVKIVPGGDREDDAPDTVIGN